MRKPFEIPDFVSLKKQRKWRTAARISNWMKVLGFRNMQEKLENEYYLAEFSPKHAQPAAVGYSVRLSHSYAFRE